MSVILGRRKPGDRWLASDTVCALAWQEYSDSLCPGCGHPRHETMDPESEMQWRADLPSRCHACTAIAEQVKAYGDATAPQALYFSVERVAPRSSR